MPSRISSALSEGSPCADQLSPAAKRSARLVNARSLSRAGSSFANVGTRASTAASCRRSLTRLPPRRRSTLAAAGPRLARCTRLAYGNPAGSESRPGRTGPPAAAWPAGILDAPAIPRTMPMRRSRIALPGHPDGLATYFASPVRHRHPRDGVPLRRAGPRARAQPQPDRLEAVARRRAAAAARGRFGTVTVLGGWFGVLGAILLADRRLAIRQVVSVDLDPRCEAIARSLNATHVRRALPRRHRRHARARLRRPWRRAATSPTCS